MSWWSSIVWRTTDLAKWGFSTSAGTFLPAAAIDNNFWILISEIQMMLDHPPSAVGIDHFVVNTDGTFVVVLTNADVIGPYTLPTIKWNFRGDWQPLTGYAVSDIVTELDKVYLVTQLITSAASFDPGATDGHGNLLYALLWTVPPFAISQASDASILSPLTDKQVLTWSTSLERWTNEFVTLSGLDDVVLLSPFDDGDVLVWNAGLGKWVSAERAVATAAASHQFLTAINSDGTASLAQPDFSDLSGTLSPSQVRAPVDALTASASISLDPTANDVFTLTPTSDCTVTPTAAPAGARITLLVTTSGTTSYSIAFANPFVAKGNLVTGKATAKKWSITFAGDGTNFVEVSRTALPERLFTMEVPASDETTALTTGTGLITFYMPADVDLTDCFIGLTAQSSSGAVQADVKKAGTTVFSTKPSVGASQDTSLTGTGSVQSVLSSNPTTLSKGDKMSIDIVTAGTSAAGLKIILIGYHR